MKHDRLENDGLSYAPCRYGTSKMFFRGPRKPLDGRYIAFVGTTETYGKFIPTPFPDLVETAIGETCVNFGCVNASIDAFIREDMILTACHDAALNVVQMMGAHNMSNRFYTVHPRRNDRFLRASTVLQAIYPEVDFTEICFTRHLLMHLFELSPDRFEIVRNELQEAWVARMRNFLGQIGGRAILVWMNKDRPAQDRPPTLNDFLSNGPLFVTRKMIDEVAQHAQAVAVIEPSDAALDGNLTGMVFSPSQLTAAQELLGPSAHAEAAGILSDMIGAILHNTGPRKASSA